MTETPTVAHDPERRALETKLTTALSDVTARVDVLQRAHGGPKDDRFALWPIETLRKAVEVELPAYLAEKAAQAQAKAELAADEHRHQHRRRFERIAEAIRAGLGMTDRGEAATADALAQAKAQADAEAAHEELAAEGAQARAKAAAALAKSKAKAVAEVRKALPVLDQAGLDAAVADAVAAVERMVAVRRDYADQVAAMGETLVAGGFDRFDGWGTPADGTGVAPSLVMLEGETFAARDVTRKAFAQVADVVAKAAK